MNDVRAVLYMRNVQHLSLHEIAKRLGLSLSEVRRAVDPKAREAHAKWAR